MESPLLDLLLAGIDHALERAAKLRWHIHQPVPGRARKEPTAAL